MGYRLGGAALAALALITVAAPAAAASFDCNKAATADERAVCSSPALSDLDVQLATLYGVRMQIPMMMGARGAAQGEQRAWPAERGACGGDIACLVHSYEQRIAGLTQAISDAMDDYCKLMGLCG